MLLMYFVAVTLLFQLPYSGVAKLRPTWPQARASPHLALVSKMIKACDLFNQTVSLLTYCIFNDSLYQYVDDNDVYKCIK